MANTRNTEEFEDPLSDYEPVVYSDPLERRLAEETAAAIQSTPKVTVSPDTTIGEALERLACLDAPCLLVVDEGALVGLFTERDVLDRVALEHDDLKSRPVRTVMTSDPVYVYETDSPAAVLNVMAVSGYRHVPVLSHDKQVTGIVSPQLVTEFLQRARVG